MTDSALRDQLARNLDDAIAESVVLQRWLYLIRRCQDEFSDAELRRIVGILDVRAYVEKALSDLGGCPTIIKWVEAKREAQS